jgi:hypothetical protein
LTDDATLFCCVCPLFLGAGVGGGAFLMAGLAG